jgi:hypothetical protein
LIPLEEEEDASRVLDVQFGEEIVILGENQPVVFAGVPRNRVVLTAEPELGDLTEAFDVVAEFS